MPRSQAIAEIELRFNQFAEPQVSIGSLLSDDADDTRLLFCLALDLKTDAIKGAVEPLANAILSSQDYSRSGIADAAESIVRANPQVLFAENDQLTSADYAAVVRLDKLRALVAGAVLADLNATTDDEFQRVLSKFGTEDGVEVGDTLNPLDGTPYKIMFVSEKRSLVETLGTLPPASTASLDQLLDRLGLPWYADRQTHVFLLLYPESAHGRLRLGRPTFFSEPWRNPGLFVSSLGAGAWGATASRTDQATKGLPERIHSRESECELPAAIRAVYLGATALPSCDRNVASLEAINRWEAVQ
jgi:hypothetical protein